MTQREATHNPKIKTRYDGNPHSAAGIFAEAAVKLIDPRVRAAMVFSDVPVEGYADRPGETEKTAFTAFLAAVCRNAAEFSHPGSIHFLCSDWRHIGEVLAAASEVYGDLQSLCVWTKDRADASSPYRSQHELVFVFKHGRATRHDNIEHERSRRHRSNVWRYPSLNVAANSNNGKSIRRPSAVKPVALVADAIRDGSARGDIVFDGFLGWGTTLIAAERTGRRCFGLEANPAHVDVAVRRWQKLTGAKARHALTDTPFGEGILKGELRHVA